MRPTVWQLALTISATTHAAALGVAGVRPTAPPPGQAHVARVQLTVAAPAVASAAHASRPLLPEPPPTPRPDRRPIAEHADGPVVTLPPTQIHADRTRETPLVARVVTRPLPVANPTAVPTPEQPAIPGDMWTRLPPGPRPPEPSGDTLAVATAGTAVDASPAVPVAGANQPPPYPGVARRRGWEGKVTLDVSVGPDGRVADVRVVRSAGHRVLDKAAVEAVRAWRFAPAHLAGVALASTVRVPIVFRLEDADPA